MNFSFTRDSSSVFVTSNVYWVCALEACDFFPRSSVFFPSKGLVKLRRSVTVEDGCMVPLEKEVVHHRLHVVQLSWCEFEEPLFWQH